AKGGGKSRSSLGSAATTAEIHTAKAMAKARRKVPRLLHKRNRTAFHISDLGCVLLFREQEGEIPRQELLKGVGRLDGLIKSAQHPFQALAPQAVYHAPAKRNGDSA